MDSDEELFTVERILSHKSSKKGRFFLVKWLNYPLTDSTWEPQENLYCKKLVQAYWENPQPQKSLKQIIREHMEAQAKSKEEGSNEETSSEELTSDEAESRGDSVVGGRPEKFKIDQGKPTEEFNYRAFLKLGFTVSALIVIAFILWTGNDNFYMERFYASRFKEEHPQHIEH